MVYGQLRRRRPPRHVVSQLDDPRRQSRGAHADARRYRAVFPLRAGQHPMVRADRVRLSDQRELVVCDRRAARGRLSAAAQWRRQLHGHLLEHLDRLPPASAPRARSTPPTAIRTRSSPSRRPSSSSSSTRAARRGRESDRRAKRKPKLRGIRDMRAAIFAALMLGLSTARRCGGAGRAGRPLQAHVLEQRGDLAGRHATCSSRRRG